MPEFTLKYADSRGEIHQQVAVANTEREVRDRYTQQGFLIYSIKARGEVAGISTGFGNKKQKLNLEKFLIFNQQFVTLIRAGLPILKGLDLLAERLTDPKLGKHIQSVRDEVRNGALLSDAFSKQGVFPPMYTTSIMAGEKSGALGEVLDRYIQYQRLSMSVRKKVLLSLMYPSILIVLVVGLVIFLITYVVPSFAQLYSSMGANLPYMTTLLIAVGTTARGYILLLAGGAVVGGVSLRYWAKTDAGKQFFDRVKLKTPVLGEVWIKYQVAQFSRVLSTLLVGGIPLLQAIETAADSIGTLLLKRTLEQARQRVREGQSLSSSLAATKVFPGLSIDMIEVGESTGALPAMLTSVAEFYEDDVNTRMTAAMALIEPLIMIFMGIFVAFVLLALYLPIFSLADTAGKPPGG
jgi:type IV pilus assembly protein PilC